MKGRFLVGGGAVFLFLLFLLAIQMRPRAVGEVRSSAQDNPKPKPQDTGSLTSSKESAVTSDSESAFRLTGTVTSSSKSALSMRMPARIVTVYVVEGQSVQAQAPLIQLDASDVIAQERTAMEAVNTSISQRQRAEVGKSAQKVKADSDIATAQAGLRQAQIKLQQAKIAKEALVSDIETEKRLAEEGIKKADEGVKLAKRTRQSLEELAKVGGVARNDLEAARNQERIAVSDLSTARTQRKRLDAGPSRELSYRISLTEKDIETATEGVRQAEEGVLSAKQGRSAILATAEREIATAQAGVVQARSVVAGLQEARSAFRLVAPISGIVTGLQARNGETAQPGMPLLTVISTQRLHIEALATAQHLAKLHLGMKGTVQFDTLPKRVYGIVLKELPVVAEPDGRTFRVKFDFMERVNVVPGQIARLLFVSSVLKP